MKKTLIVFAILVLISVPVNFSFAQEIYVGNVSARSEVHTYVEGNSNVQTNISVEVNGEKKSLIATGSGDYKLEINSSSNTDKPEINPSPVPTISPVKKKIIVLKQRKTVLNILQTEWKNFWDRVMLVFKFNK
jgi:hypothetical protein